MIRIDIDPNIISIGQFTLAWQGVFSAIGIIVGILLTLALLRGGNISDDDVYTLALWAVVGGIIGARLFHVVDDWGFYSKNPAQIIAMNEGGLSLYGAIVVGTFSVLVAMLVKHVAVGRFLDAGALGLVLGQAVGRAGDIISGAQHGLPTGWAIGVRYIHPNTLGEPGKVVHLAVGYEMVWDLIILAVLLLLRKRLTRDGMVYGLYTALYGFGRFFISFTRADSRTSLGLSQDQIIALFLTAVSVIALAWMGARSPQMKETVAKVEA
ncbi:MAG: prolipoprotein diacylglyceryl transferase [Dehalococcoidia bacterium]|nr:prolipoprotein diacylglyceryl transferase [Dehalococcoidia bacterium]